MTTTTYTGDCRELVATLPERSVQACVTSPPYFGLRAYSDDAREIGREQTPEHYIAHLVAVFAAVRRVLRDDGVLVLNLGDSFGRGSRPLWQGDAERGTNAHQAVSDARAYGAGAILPEKSKLLIPHRVALALQADGWILRQDMPWIKRNAMPESVTDRPTTAHEYVFLLAKSARYFWDADAVRTEASAASLARINQPTFDQQTGGPKDYGNGINPNRSMRKTLENFAANPGRNYRTTDPWFASLDAAIADARAALAHLEAIKARGGLLTDDDGDPLALQVNPTPYKQAHFAVFPPALVEPCIRAGTPQQCCPTCGAGWVRQVERTGHVSRREPAHVPGNTQTKVDSTGWAPTTRPTDRFAPGCTCPNNNGSGRAVVLDPFAGSGTTLRVAEQLGRDSIGIDLNPEYADLQAKRLNGVQVELPL